MSASATRGGIGAALEAGGWPAWEMWSAWFNELVTYMDESFAEDVFVLVNEHRPSIKRKHDERPVVLFLGTGSVYIFLPWDGAPKDPTLRIRHDCEQYEVSGQEWAAHRAAVERAIREAVAPVTDQPRRVTGHVAPRLRDLDSLPEKWREELVLLTARISAGARPGPADPSSTEPQQADAARCPDLAYAFRSGDETWRVGSTCDMTIRGRSVTWRDRGEPLTRAWDWGWRTGLDAWTAHPEDLVGRWIRRSTTESATWASLSEIRSIIYPDLQVWVPGWPEWRPAAATVAQAQRPDRRSPPVVPLRRDDLFEATRGPCADAPGGLAQAYPKYASALAGIEVHVVDRSNVRYYRHAWGVDEWEGESNLLPQASVVFARGSSVALEAFYRWMRHVALPTYPVLHEVEWASELDDESPQSYRADACGHPSLIVAPVQGVAAGIVFDHDRTELVQALRFVQDDGRPAWVPTLTTPYPFVCSLTAAHAMTDEWVGWSVWIPSRTALPGWWQRTRKVFREEIGPRYTLHRRWPEDGWHWHNPNQHQLSMCSEYETDNLGRSPHIRARWSDLRGPVMSELTFRTILSDIEPTSYRLIDANERSEAIFLKLDQDWTIWDGSMTRAMSVQRILSLGNGVYQDQLVDGPRRTLWRRYLSSHKPLRAEIFHAAREEFAAALRPLVPEVFWDPIGRGTAGGVVIARLQADVSIEVSSNCVLHPGWVRSHAERMELLSSVRRVLVSSLGARAPLTSPRDLMEEFIQALSGADGEVMRGLRDAADARGHLDDPSVHPWLEKQSDGEWGLTLFGVGTWWGLVRCRPAYGFGAERWIPYALERWEAATTDRVVK